MTALVRGELHKLRTTRLLPGMVLGAVAVVALGTASTVLSADPDTLTGPLHDQTFYLLTSINLGVFALVLGMRGFTDEFRHGTIVTTLLSHGSRTRVLLAKALVAGLAAVVLTLAAIATMALLAALAAGTKDGSLVLTSADAGPLAGLVLGMVVWSLIGVAVGALVRHQVAAVVAALVWVLVVENLASGLLEEAGRFLPGQAVHALAVATQAGVAGTWWQAAIVLAVYLLGAAGLAAITLDRRDAV